MCESAISVCCSTILSFEIQNEELKSGTTVVQVGHQRVHHHGLKGDLGPAVGELTQRCRQIDRLLMTRLSSLRSA